jgi:hypothetical protein
MAPQPAQPSQRRNLVHPTMAAMMMAPMIIG